MGGWLRNPLYCPAKKWDACGTKGTLNLSLIFSIMATNIGNSNNAPGSSQSVSNKTSKLKSWADRTEEFSSNLKENNAFFNHGERFFVIKRNDGDFSKTSPFLIQKAIQSIIGEPKNIKKLRSGELLIELQNQSQVSNQKKLQHTRKHPHNSYCTQITKQL